MRTSWWWEKDWHVPWSQCHQTMMKGVHQVAPYSERTSLVVIPRGSEGVVMEDRRGEVLIRVYRVEGREGLQEGFEKGEGLKGDYEEYS